eukprot:444272-Prorocentrum_minimum.AAC.1
MITGGTTFPLEEADVAEEVEMEEMEVVEEGPPDPPQRGALMQCGGHPPSNNLEEGVDWVPESPPLGRAPPLQGVRGGRPSTPDEAEQRAPSRRGAVPPGGGTRGEPQLHGEPQLYLSELMAHCATLPPQCFPFRTKVHLHPCATAVL